MIAGNLVTYTMTATNLGAASALNLKSLTHYPPERLHFSRRLAGRDADNPGGRRQRHGQRNLDALAARCGLTPAGTTRTLTIVARVCPEVACGNLTDTATVTSDPRIRFAANNSASATATVQSQSDLSITKTGTPTQIQPGQPVTYTLSFSNAGPSNSANTVVTDILPSGFTVVGTPTSTVAGTTFNVTTSNGVTTVTANLGVLGAANQCATTRPTSGTITIVAVVLDTKYPNGSATNTATIATGNCLPDPNLANNTATFDIVVSPLGGGPGAPVPAGVMVSDQKAGSILVFPIYTSSATNPGLENTRLNITNTSTTDMICVHLFAMDGSTCSPMDAYLCPDT